MDDFFERFLRYRYDFAALVFDSYATFLRPGRAAGRVFAAVAGTLLISAPAYVLVVGDQAFGNPWAFGVALIGFPVLLEAPGYNWRRRGAGAAVTGAVADDYDRFLFAVAGLVSIAAPVILLSVHDRGPVIGGVVWGLALAGAQDLARSAIAAALALSSGTPVYPSGD